PFTQADSSLTRRFSGSGLGLSICRALSRELGGEVTVATREGSGSTFTLTIPAGEGRDDEAFEPVTRAGTAASPHATPTLRSRVLVVDDHADMRSLEQTILEEAGADVALAVDGEQALAEVAAAEARSEPFTAVLLDMQMPVRDGYSTATELRNRGYSGAIIAVTAHARKGDELRCRASGCDDYLSKPIERARLVGVVAHYAQDVVRAELRAQRRPHAPGD
ncbi:MAG: response regulator, partial [Gammaproteobacteria bacterium]|nr:response regulator [Gammaproteobacteria bacterium]